MTNWIKVSLSVFILLISLSAWSQLPGFDWAKRFGGWGTVDIQDIDVGASGRIFVLGTFVDTVDFDPGPGVQKLTGVNGHMFILELTPAGDLSWVKQFTVSSSYNIVAKELAVDTSGNFFIAGSFKNGWSDFDPSPATYSLNSQVSDGFLLKLDPFGNFLWVKEFNGNVVIEDLQIDLFQNVYLSGSFEGVTDFDPGPQNALYQTQNIAFNGFLLKMSSGGNFRWVKVFTGNQFSDVYQVRINNAGKVYYGGKAAFGIDLDPGTPTFTLNNPCAFMGRVDSLGNYMGSAVLDGSGTVYSLLLKGGEIIASGEYNGLIDLDPGPNQQTVTINNQDGGFLLKTDTTFNLIWAKTILSPTNSSVFNMRLTEGPGSDFYLFADFRGTFDFDTGGGVFYLTSSSSMFQMSGDIACVRYDSNGDLNSGFSLGPGGFRNVPAFYHLTDNIIIGGAYFKTFDADPSSSSYMLNIFPYSYKSGFVLRLADCLRKPSVNLNASRNLVCEGDGINLSASGASWYYWGTGLPSAPGVAVTVSATTLYSVTGYDDEGCYAGAAINVVADKCVGLEEQTESVPSVYPNPADHSIVIKPGVYRRAQVFDSSGKLLQDYQINETENSIDVKSLPAGAYHLHLEDRYQMRTVQKFIKQ